MPRAGFESAIRVERADNMQITPFLPTPTPPKIPSDSDATAPLYSKHFHFAQGVFIFYYNLGSNVISAQCVSHYKVEL
jgi:hypothetical protein